MEIKDVCLNCIMLTADGLATTSKCDITKSIHVNTTILKSYKLISSVLTQLCSCGFHNMTKPVHSRYCSTLQQKQIHNSPRQCLGHRWFDLDLRFTR